MESSIAEFLQRRAVCNPGLPLGQSGQPGSSSGVKLLSPAFPCRPIWLSGFFFSFTKEETNRQTDKQTKRHTTKQTNRHTHKPTDRHTYTHTHTHAGAAAGLNQSAEADQPIMLCDSWVTTSRLLLCGQTFDPGASLT
jgi:hypothetical protein